MDILSQCLMYTLIMIHHTAHTIDRECCTCCQSCIASKLTSVHPCMRLIQWRKPQSTGVGVPLLVVIGGQKGRELLFGPKNH